MSSVLLIDQLVERVKEIITWINSTSKVNAENAEFLIKRLKEQQEMNEHLLLRIKNLEDYVAEHILLGDNNENNKS
jgi:hypothetical protein